MGVCLSFSEIDPIKEICIKSKEKGETTNDRLRILLLGCQKMIATQTFER